MACAYTLYCACTLQVTMAPTSGTLSVFILGITDTMGRLDDDPIAFVTDPVSEEKMYPCLT